MAVPVQKTLVYLLHISVGSSIRFSPSVCCSVTPCPFFIHLCPTSVSLSLLRAAGWPQYKLQGSSCI